MPSNTPAEFRFLLRALRAFRNCDEASDLIAASDGLDWAVIIAGIRRHGISWVSGLLSAEPGLIPAEYATALRQASTSQVIATLQRVGETARVSAALAAAGVRFLVVKGAPLSIQLHGEAARRPARDIDILIAPGKAIAVERLMLELGYVRPDGESAEHAIGEAMKEVGYVHRDKRILVEVHDRLTDNPELLPWAFETLWSEHVRVRIGNVQVPTLAPSRLPIYLCVHGARHCWSRLIWLEDLANTLDSPEAIDRAMTDARALGLEPLMLHALHILHDWLGHPVPADLLMRAQASRQVRVLDAIVAWFHRDPRWFEAPAHDSWRRFRQGSIQLRAFAYAMKMSGRYWRRQLSIELVSPADHRLFRLPRYLAWLYIPLRPAGWLLRRL